MAGVSPTLHDARVSAVIPVWNGRRWLEGCLGSLVAQTHPPAETILVDNGSYDDSVAFVRERFPDVTIVELGANTGFAKAANVGIERATGELIALLNTDVVLSRDWLARMTEAIRDRPRMAAVACKMLQLDTPGTVYDAGDILRRDGACEQRGRFGPDDGRWDDPGEVFGACAGAALYRRAAVFDVGGFDERYFAYLEDVDLALRLRLRGWSCWYESVVAWHAGEGSSHQLSGGHWRWVERNTLLLVAGAFPWRWFPLVLYRQLGWARQAARERRLGAHLRGALAAVPMLAPARRRRRHLIAEAVVPIESVVVRRPIRGPRAGGYDENRGARAHR
jgi:GT2 family glycosyltransferase